ncbi:MAG: porin [Alphaproteobacteria bacterium]
MGSWRRQRRTDAGEWGACPKPAGVPTTSAAPSAADERIAVLEQELRDLSAQIADLKQSTASNLDDIRASQAANTTVIANGRPTTASGDGQQKFAVRGLVQFDAAHYSEQGNPAYTNDLSSGTNFRRARLGVEGTFAKDWNYALTGEFGGQRRRSRPAQSRLHRICRLEAVRPGQSAAHSDRRLVDSHWSRRWHQQR